MKKPDREWLPIKGYDGLYEISNTGLVRSWKNSAGNKVKEFYRDMDNPQVSYETLRLFYNGSTTASGHTINEIERHLQSKGYGIENDS